jgi:hypothetical protein
VKKKKAISVEVAFLHVMEYRRLDEELFRRKIGCRDLLDSLAITICDGVPFVWSLGGYALHILRLPVMGWQNLDRMADEVYSTRTLAVDSDAVLLHLMPYQ